MTEPKLLLKELNRTRTEPISIYTHC